MSDGGEGLVDASSRLAERMEEQEEARRAARTAGDLVSIRNSGARGKNRCAWREPTSSGSWQA